MHIIFHIGLLTASIKIALLLPFFLESCPYHQRKPGMAYHWIRWAVIQQRLPNTVHGLYQPSVPCQLLRGNLKEERLVWLMVWDIWFRVALLHTHDVMDRISSQWVGVVEEALYLVVNKKHRAKMVLETRCNPQSMPLMTYFLEPGPSFWSFLK